MSNPLNRSYEATRTQTRADVDVGLRKHMLRVYNLMASGVLLSGIVAFFVASSPAVLNALFSGPQAYVVMFAPLIMVFAMSFGMHKMRGTTLQALFWAFCVLMGASLSTILLAYTGTSVARVFFITAGAFAGLSLWGYTTKKDLTGWGSFLIIGLFGIIIASIVNLFLGSTGLEFAISVLGVLIFAGLTAYDTQKIKEIYLAVDSGYGMDGVARGESLTKMATMGALSLYLDFINMFLMLLRLFGSRE